jgi:hypothetical protein
MSTDIYFSDVSLLLHMNGANNSTSFLDSSSSTKTVTANGGAKISNVTPKFGSGNGFFNSLDSVEDYLSITTSLDSFRFSTNDFTIECWIRCTIGNAAIIDAYSGNPSSSIDNGYQLFINNSGNIEFWIGANVSATVTSSGDLRDGNWHHVAISKNSGNFRLFIDGTQSGGTQSDSTNLNFQATMFAIGAQYWDGDVYFPYNGYIDELRVTKGIGRYTSNFTPATEEFPEFDKINAISSDSGVLSNVSVVGNIITFARADVPSMLGAANPLATHDFTSVIGDATTYYVMDLTTPSGLVRVPISSWQATLQSGLSNYVQCVVPAVSDYVSAINAATQFKISRLVDVPGLATPLTYEMATAPVQTTTFDQGPFRYTCTISGYSSGFAPNETPSAAYNRIMQGIRSISINQGGTRVRCSIDWLLRPSQRVFASSEEFVVSYINYYVGEGDAYMEVGERA